MAARYILTSLSFVFLVLALSRLRQGPATSQIRTWLIIAIIFGTVSAWLWSRA